MGNLAEVSISLTAAAAGNYAAGDVISDSASAGTYLTFPGVAGDNGGAAKIFSARYECDNDAQVTALRLWLFHTAPTASALNDNGAFSLHANDFDKVAGIITFPTATDAGAESFAQAALTVPLVVQCASGDRDLYGILQDTVGEEDESAGQIFRISLGVEQS